MTSGDIEGLMRELQRHDIVIALDGDRLDVEYPIDEVPEALIERLRRDEQALVDALRRSARAPLSFAQQRLWIIDRLEGGSAHYHLPVAIRLRGEIDVDAIRAAFDAILTRHDVLRTRFAGDGADVHAVVRAPMPAVFPCRRPPEGSVTSRDAWIAAEIAAEATQPFDLARDDMLRGALLHCAHDEAVLLVTLHHIAADAWSVGVLVREFQAHYVAYRAGRPAFLPPLRLQYADHARRQRQRLAHVPESIFGYWQQRLDRLPPVHALPTDRPRPARQSFDGAALNDTIGEHLLDRLRVFARERRTTLFVILQSAFTALLYRLSGQQDITLGVPVAGRDEVDLEPMIGFFVNTVVLRAAIDPATSFDAFVRSVHDDTMAAMEHAALPFEWLVERLNPERSRAFSPLFQVMFSLHPAEVARASLPGLQLDVLDSAFNGVKCDLELEIAESATGLSLRWAYATALFDTPRIERMAAQFRQILDVVLADPETLLADLPIVAPGDAARLAAWNDTHVAFPQHDTLIGLFEASVAATPDAIAVIHDAGQLSYVELDEWAERIAAFLRTTHGIVPGERVGHGMARSPAMLACLLGIMKAGAAYVALDHALPDDRLRYMLQDSGASVVLADTATALRLAGHRAAIVDVGATVWDAWPSDRGGHVVAPDDLAYVIYTSGSTGVPKGTLNAHRGVCNRLHAMQRQFDLVASDRVMHKTPLGFDVSVWEMFWPWMVGATVVLAAPEGHKDPRYIENAASRHGVTVLHFVPSMLQMFLRAAEPRRLVALRFLMASGEAISRELQAESIAAFPGIRLINHYGPTETAIEVSWWPFDVLRPDGIVPIGRPIANTRLYVLDERGREQPIGVPGELHIGGVQVGQGYLNKPELTAERFVTRALHGSVERLYRTGDLARWLEDGQIQYLGRLDHQVKLRGVRVELGELEARLREHPLVADAVATVTGELADQVLACYVVPAAGAAADTAAFMVQLRRSLVDTLPAYMQQCRFAMLDRLPLSANGKVDRQALPPVHDIETIARDHVAASGVTERALTAVWSQVLDTPVARIGTTDNFFDIGGNSLRTIALQVAVRSALGMDIAIADFFQYPTIAGQAQLIDRGSVPREDRSAATSAAKQRIFQARSRRAS
ncbi:non-ribosomal peptide synthetase [Luteibacter sp. dw_328]|uniref:non-ribosomal peptide synthetase n=1 Tax=Luteibacter sp. dw_328 TaxID=2719796 RepID=UPI001BD23B0B|nr:non-ribosomal peptide synthetase [Luteibacter sp. dw_328]